MADAPVRVEVTDHFLARLDTIERFLDEANASVAFDRLLEDLRAIVLPNLARFPQMGRRFLDLVPRSAEALASLRLLPSSSVDSLREYLHSDYLILYTQIDATVYLLSIRHHGELAYDFERIWPGG
jgi:plasmid stabilization system protein ParE